MHPCGSIHQEAFFKATRQRIYNALTDSGKFTRVMEFSQARKRGLPPGAPSTRIGSEAGGELGARSPGRRASIPS
jgi:hypothetical protein